jgi:hypothetical protein
MSRPAREREGRRTRRPYNLALGPTGRELIGWSAFLLGVAVVFTLRRALDRR